MKESAITTQVDNYKVKYDFSSFGLLKRLRMAIAIVFEGGFFIKGKHPNRTTIKP